MNYEKVITGIFSQIQNTSLRKKLLCAIRNHWTRDSTAIKADERRVGHCGIAGSVEHFKQ